MFFFKQKTADAMRISDWSSDVCASDLDAALRGLARHLPARAQVGEVLAPQAEQHEEQPEADQGSEQDDRCAHAHHPPGRFSTLGSKPTATRSSRLRVCIGEAGTARRSGPGAKISLELTMVPSRSEEHTSELQSLMRI